MSDTRDPIPEEDVPAARNGGAKYSAVSDKTSRPLPSRPPRGFGKGVNDYLNQYVVVADAKAGAILAASLALCAVLLDHRRSDGQTAIFVLALAALAVAAVISIVTIFPRLPSGGTGIIFWEDVRKRGSIGAYYTELRGHDDDDVEREYASQNWHVSGLLHKKLRLVQWAIAAFVAGVLLAGWSALTAQ